MYQRRIVLASFLALLLGTPAWAGEAVSFGPLVGPNGNHGEAEFGSIADRHGIYGQMGLRLLSDSGDIQLGYGPIIDPSG